MVMKGDVDKLYRHLHKKYGDHLFIKNIHEMKDVKRIWDFYNKFDQQELRFLYAKMKKEHGGIGMIPLVASSLSFVGFIFGENLRNWINHYDPYGWILFIIVYTTFIVAALYLHYREKAWSTLHLTVVESILAEKAEP